MMASLSELARSIFIQSLAACNIEHSMQRMLWPAGGGSSLLLDGKDLTNLDSVKHLRIVAAGKAASAMTAALLARLHIPATCQMDGVVIALERPPTLPATMQFFRGGHPSPNAASFAGGSAALSMMQSASALPAERTLCFFLISGGASSMMELPLDASISLDDTVAFHQALVHSGASIVEMNCVRKHFSAVKGGRLAFAAGPAKQISLLVSDVPPAQLDALGSGPTLPDSTTVSQCRQILASHALLERFPPSVRAFFASDRLAETPKPGQISSPVLKLMDSDDLAEAARSHAASLGFHAVIDNSCDDWSYDAAADYLLNRLRQLRREHARVCLISTGEVSVKLPSSSSQQRASEKPVPIGGRNQHFALYAATKLNAFDGPIAVLSSGSDGIDGNSPAAGAVVDEKTLGADPPSARREEAYCALQEFNSFSWLAEAGASIVTGSTGNNLRDLRVLLADKRE